MDSITEYACDKCDLKFQRKDVYERHLAVHNKDTFLQCHICQTVVRDQKELTEHAQTHIEKTVYECLLCDEKFTVAHNYYTHMLVSHEMSKEVAKLMHTEKKDQQVVKALTKNATVLDPNLPLPVEQTVPASSEVKVTHATSSAFNVNQMVSSILDDNKATLNAMTRVATENLCLHSQDIGDEEKTAALLPPVNPMSTFEKNHRLLPLDHLSHDVGYNLPKKQGLSLVSCQTEMSDHGFGQTLNEARNTMVHQLGLQQDNSLNDNQLTQLPVSDALAFSNSVAVLDIGSLSSFIGQRSQSNVTPMTNLGGQLGLPSLEHGAIESLRRLQDTSDPPVTNTLEAILIAQRQPGVLVSGNLLDRDSSSDSNSVGYRIQNLF